MDTTHGLHRVWTQNLGIMSPELYPWATRASVSQLCDPTQIKILAMCGTHKHMLVVIYKLLLLFTKISKI